MRAMAVGALAVFGLVAAACTGDDETPAADATDTPTATTADVSTASTEPVADATMPATTMNTLAVTGTPSTPSTEPPPSTTMRTTTTTIDPITLEPWGAIAINVIAPDEALPRLVPAIVDVGGTPLGAGRCEIDYSLDAGSGGIFHHCRVVPTGEYQVAFDESLVPGERIITTLSCGVRGGPRSGRLVVNAEQTTECQAWVNAMGVRFLLLYDAPPNWQPIILGSDGSAVEVSCSTTPFSSLVECWDLPPGAYEIPEQTVVTGLDDTSFVCAPGFGGGFGPSDDNTVTLAEGLDQSMWPSSIWTCEWTDIPPRDMARDLTINVSGPPESTLSIRPVLRQDGVDVFDERCSTTGYSPRTGLTYSCTGLAFGPAELEIPPLRDQAVSVSCDVATAQATESSATIDLAENFVASCSVNLFPPIFIVGAMVPDAPDIELAALTADGPDGGIEVTRACERWIEPYDGFFEVWFFCWPAPFGPYAVPDQPVFVDGPDEAFRCAPGIGVSFGVPWGEQAFLAPGIDPATGVPQFAWTCATNEFIIE